MMRLTVLGAALCLLGSGVIATGCSQSSSAVTGNADAGHAHEHSHSHDHDHDHDHGHRKAEPLLGGSVVTIGHSHHASGETYYHAEVMPVEQGQITFHILTENAEGHPEPFTPEESDIVAYVDPTDAESQPQEVVFQAEGETEAATFVAAVPDSFLESKELSVVVPRIRLGGERLSFSFTAIQSDDSSEPEPSDVTSEEPAE